MNRKHAVKMTFVMNSKRKRGDNKKYPRRKSGGISRQTKVGREIGHGKKTVKMQEKTPERNKETWPREHPLLLFYNA